MQRATSGVGGTFQSSSAVDLGRRWGGQGSNAAHLQGCVSTRRNAQSWQKKKKTTTTSLARAIENMAGGSSLEAVKKKIKSLQEQADAAEDRASLFQRELNQERNAREAVSRR